MPVGIAGTAIRLTPIMAGLILAACVPPGQVSRPQSGAVAAQAVPPQADPAPDPAPSEALPAETPPPRPVWQAQPVFVNAQTAPDGRRYHVVGPGETGIAIARAYGVPWARIVAANGLSEPYVIKSGQKLYLDGDASANAATTTTAGSPPSRDPVEARARAFHLDIDALLRDDRAVRAATTGSTPPRGSAVTSSAPLHAAGQFIWPIRGTIVARYGPAGAGHFNQGIDIAAPALASIRAAADGVVAYVGDGVAGYGGLVLIQHPNGWISAYGHLDTMNVQRGDSVAKGAAIGQIANDSDQALHFELRFNRKPVDPQKYLAAR